MHQVPIVTCTRLYYMTNFGLPAEIPHYKVMVLVRDIVVNLKSEMRGFFLAVTLNIAPFEAIGVLQRKDCVIACCSI